MSETDIPLFVNYTSVRKSNPLVPTVGNCIAWWLPCYLSNIFTTWTNRIFKHSWASWYMHERFHKHEECKRCLSVKWFLGSVIMNILCTLCLSPIQEIRDPLLARYKLTVSPYQGYFYIQLFEISLSTKWGQNDVKLVTLRKIHIVGNTINSLSPFTDEEAEAQKGHLTWGWSHRVGHYWDFNIKLFFVL